MPSGENRCDAFFLPGAQTLQPIRPPGRQQDIRQRGYSPMLIIGGFYLFKWTASDIPVVLQRG